MDRQGSLEADQALGRLRRLQEGMGRAREDRLFHRRAGLRHLRQGRIAGGAPRRIPLDLLVPRKRTAEKTHDLVRRLDRALRIARRVAQTDQESDVTANAISHLAKPGQVHEKALLEERGERAVEICKSRESPEARGDLRTFARELEEVRQQAEAVPNLSV
jgi:hypothetical protein